MQLCIKYIIGIFICNSSLCYTLCKIINPDTEKDCYKNANNDFFTIFIH